MKEKLNQEKQLIVYLDRFRDHPIRVDEEREIQFLEEKRDEILERLILPMAGKRQRGHSVPRLGIELLQDSRVVATFMPRSLDANHGCKIIYNFHYYELSRNKILWSLGKWNQMETLAHELVHFWQLNYGSGKPSHGREFVNFSSMIGLHVIPELGFHTAVAGWPLSELMKEWGYPKPEFVKQVYSL